MIGLVAHKMTGSGNDFVFVDGRFANLGVWTEARIRAVCDRRTGVGADGFVLVEPGSRSGAVRMVYFNRDGSRAPMCGNAALCATRFAGGLELAPLDGMTLETDAGTYASRCLSGPGERAELQLGGVKAARAVDVRLAAGEKVARLAAVGVPHLVVVVEDVAGVPVGERGRALRFDPAVGAGGANVNFVGPARPDQGASGGPQVSWSMRTYERGVEDETLACGTGAVAVALVLNGLRSATLPFHVLTGSGCVLSVGGSPDGDGLSDVRLAGEGRLVFRAALGDIV
jgi:diaminopimelate epimerase